MIVGVAFMHIIASIEALRAGEVWLTFWHARSTAEALPQSFLLLDVVLVAICLGGVFAADGLILIRSLQPLSLEPEEMASEAEWVAQDVRPRRWSHRRATPGVAAGIGAIVLLAAITFSLVGITRIVFVAVILAVAVLLSLLTLLLRISDLSRAVADMREIDAHIAAGQRHLDTIRAHADRRTSAV